LHVNLVSEKLRAWSGNLILHKEWEPCIGQLNSHENIFIRYAEATLKTCTIRKTVKVKHSKICKKHRLHCVWRKPHPDD